MNKTSILAYYNKKAKNLVQKYESANVNDLHSIMRSYFQPNSYLLELGCGSGRDASYLHKSGYKIIATDGSAEMIKEAKHQHPELIENFRIVKIPSGLSQFEKSYFDGIYSIATLMHLRKSEIELTLKLTTNLLKQNGIFLFSVPIKRPGINEEGFDNNGLYYEIMSETDWVNVCTKYGYKLEHTTLNNDGMARKAIVWLTCVMRK